MAHFRKTKFHGMTPCIVGLDGNRHLLPLSWGACRTEDETEHTQHFRKFREAVELQDPQLNLGEIIGFGDRDKGMGAAADRELGMVTWFNDLKHASSNIALAVKGCGLAVRMKFETAASVYTKEEARVIMQEIPHDNIAVYKYIIETGMNNFFRSESTVPRFGMLGTQAVESFNSVTKRWRGLPRLHLFKKVEQHVQSLFDKRRQQVDQARHKYRQPKACVPSIVDDLLASQTEANHYDCHRLSDTDFAVFIPASVRCWKVTLMLKMNEY